MTENAPGSRLQAAGKRTYPFEDLDVWKMSIDLAAMVYDLTKAFPKDEIYGLTSQIRRAAASVPANIAEGKGRYSKRDFRNFLFTARGSLYEVVTHLKLAHKLGYIDQSAIEKIGETSHQIISKLSGLIRSLEDPIVSDLEPGALSLEQP